MTIQTSCYNALGYGIREYRTMFNLNDADLGSSILDCHPGASLFLKELEAINQNCTATDPLYALSIDEIANWLDNAMDIWATQVKKYPERYLHNETALLSQFYDVNKKEQFLKHFSDMSSNNQYKQSALPSLNEFENDSFDIVLSHHLLFVQADKESFNFHLEGLLEMARIGKEVRIFPLITLEGELSPFIDDIIFQLQAHNYSAELRAVKSNFFSKGNAMLRVWQN